MSLPLAGVRVVDLSRLLPGPMCSWYLRGLGATVIKVEEPRVGDPLRHLPPAGPDGLGAWFSAINAGVHSVRLQLSAADDQALLHGLLSEADVLIEGFRPGALARLGLDPALLRARHPRLILASISGFGQQGPLKNAPGHDLGYIGYAGHLALGARPGGVPAVPALQLADLAGGALLGALQISAALFARSQSGQGAWLDVNMTAGALSLAVPALAEAAVGAAPAPGQGALTGGLPFYACYACQDGRFITVAALEPNFQAAFEAEMGFAFPGSPAEAAALFAGAPRDQWVARLGGACVGPALSLDEALGHPLHAAQVRGEGAGRRVAPPFPGPHPWVLAPAPALGASDPGLRAAGAAGAGYWAAVVGTAVPPGGGS